MTTTTKEPSKRRTVRGVQAQSMGRTQVGGRGPRQLGAADEDERTDYMVDDHDPLDSRGALAAADALMVELEQREGLHADGLRYGPLGFVALEVVGVPVRREAGDEYDWCWKRLMQLNEIAREVRVGGQWDMSWRVVDRAERVYLRAQEVWRRMCERWARIGCRSHGCVSLVVVGERRVGA
jgi:hypothetical protein